MKVTVFGIGYVGLVQAAVLAEAGHQVCCVDVNPKRVADLQAGIIPIFEPGLSALVKQGVCQGLLKFTTDGVEGVAFGELQFIAVGTPPDEDGSADLKYVLKVASTIAENMTTPKVV
ncbi:MAG: UDP-glucose 6-dehydrogenase, partial [Gammaproteobacteria bacterium]|nr:UDP-glucose 6-dehydrogenase [Gammaproteobacteria bacterium]